MGGRRTKSRHGAWISGFEVGEHDASDHYQDRCKALAHPTNIHDYRYFIGALSYLF